MDPKVLVTEQVDAGAEFIAELDKTLPLRAAFWMKPADGKWMLFTVIDNVEEHPGRGYGEVLRAANAIGNPYLDPFQVKLVSAKDPVCQDVLAMHRRYPGRFPINLNETMIGGRTIDGAYLYPLPEHAAGT